MKKNNDLSSHFLVAMPSLDDPNFSKAVIYICEHTKDGAMGLVINKPMHVTLGNVMKHLNITVEADTVTNYPVLMGGPVGQEHGFVLHSPLPKNTNEDDVVISASKDILKTIAKGDGPENYLIALGYAGWEPGQLDEEINRNDWLVVPFNADILFKTPLEQRWLETTKLLGVDISQLSDQVGHA